MATLSVDTITAAAGIFGGLVSWKLLNVGNSPLLHALGFLVGAAPAAVFAHIALVEDSDNVKLVSRSWDFATTNPSLFALMAMGITMAFSILYELFVEPEVEAITAFLPVLSLRNQDVAIALLGLTCAMVFGAFAGWTIEVLEWLVGPDGRDMKAVPIKPGGRQKWGLKKLPKDLVFFLFAVPIAIIESVTMAVNKKSLIPLMFAFTKAATDQWTRLGDLIIDAVATEEELAQTLGKAFHAFDDLIHGVFGAMTTRSEVEGERRFRSLKDQTIDMGPDPYAAYYAVMSGSEWLGYPTFFTAGDND